MWQRRRRRLCGCKMPRNCTAVHAHVHKRELGWAVRESEEHAKTDTYTKQGRYWYGEVVLGPDKRGRESGRVSGLAWPGLVGR